MSPNPKTPTTTGVEVTVTAPLLPVALATGHLKAAALVIIAAALTTIEEQERSDVTAAQT